MSANSSYHRMEAAIADIATLESCAQVDQPSSATRADGSQVDITRIKAKSDSGEWTSCGVIEASCTAAQTITELVEGVCTVGGATCKTASGLVEFSAQKQYNLS